MEIWYSFTQPPVVPNLYILHTLTNMYNKQPSVEHKRRRFEDVLVTLFQTDKISISLKLKNTDKYP